MGVAATLGKEPSAFDVHLLAAVNKGHARAVRDLLSYGADPFALVHTVTHFDFRHDRALVLPQACALAQALGDQACLEAMLTPPWIRERLWSGAALPLSSAVAICQNGLVVRAGECLTLATLAIEANRLEGLRALLQSGHDTAFISEAVAEHWAGVVLRVLRSGIFVEGRNSEYDLLVALLAGLPPAVQLRAVAHALALRQATWRHEGITPVPEHVEAGRLLAGDSLHVSPLPLALMVGAAPGAAAGAKTTEDERLAAACVVLRHPHWRALRYADFAGGTLLHACARMGWEAGVDACLTAGIPADCVDDAGNMADAAARAPAIAARCRAARARAAAATTLQQAAEAAA